METIGEYCIKKEYEGWRVWRKDTENKWWFFPKQEDALDWIDKRNKGEPDDTIERA